MMTNPPTDSPTQPILHLDLGPLDLELLGLQVQLDKVVLDVAAVTGPGNLLGNLLAAVAALLDGVALAEMLQGLLENLVAGLTRMLEGIGGGGSPSLAPVALT